HKIDHLIDILENIKSMTEPVLLHVSTIKGKGYEPAENNPVFFHGVGCFEIETGECPAKQSAVPTYTDVFGNCMVQLARANRRIVAVTAAMPEGTGLSKFAETFPDRFFDVGIAEQHGVTFAAGIAAEGYRPVVAIYSTFLQRAYDQIVHDVCIESLPVVFAIDRGGIVGEDGATHHGLFDLSFLRSIPNMVIMAPKDENELCQMLATAVTHNGPIALRYPRGKAVGVPLDGSFSSLTIGKAEILTTGDDVLIIAIGATVQASLDAHKRLLTEGIQATVVNARFVKPVDSELIVSLAKQIPRIITVEDNVLPGGFGSAVLETLSDQNISQVQVVRLGIPDVFVEHGPQTLLRTRSGIDEAGIFRAAKKLMPLP
ncbi:MAG: 1-deoxy-D-xylulose-5-phosphate synthase, partial [Desulfatirhabdiaceae bacterium]